MHGVVSLSQDKYTAEGKPEDLFSGKPFMICSFMLMECVDATPRWIQTFTAASEGWRRRPTQDLGRQAAISSSGGSFLFL